MTEQHFLLGRREYLVVVVELQFSGDSPIGHQGGNLLADTDDLAARILSAAISDHLRQPYDRHDLDRVVSLQFEERVVHGVLYVLWVGV